jgi:hypothetical protein
MQEIAAAAGCQSRENSKHIFGETRLGNGVCLLVCKQVFL